MRAKCHFEDIDKGQRQAIIVDELPYQVNKKTLQERMAELVHEKKIEGISHIQDESDKSGMRLVIELKRGEVPEVVLNNLYKQTQLQDTFGINMVALIDGQPRLCNLKDLIRSSCSTAAKWSPAARCSTCARRATAAMCWKAWPWRWPISTNSSASSANRPRRPVAKAELMTRSWDSKLVREMLTRARRWRRGQCRRLPPRGAWSANSAWAIRWPVPPERNPGQEILQMRLQRLTGLEQDKIVGRIQRRDGRDRRPARHPGQARARVHHHWR
jgi:DNA gyrase subunit A